MSTISFSSCPIAVSWILILFSSATGQIVSHTCDWPVSLEIGIPNPKPGDTTSLSVYLGNSQFPLDGAEEVAVMLTTDPTKAIFVGTGIALEGTELGDEVFVSSATLSAGRDTLVIVLSRSDASPFQGYGFAFSLTPGIAIVAEEELRLAHLQPSPGHTPTMRCVPNPVHDWFLLVGEGLASHFEVFTLEGKRIFEGDGCSLVDASAWPRGVYRVVVYTSFGPQSLTVYLR